MRLGRAVAAAAIGMIVASVTAAGAGDRAGAAPPTDVEQQLLDRYAPVVAVRQHPDECGDGERFLPVSVDVILGRPDVVLRDADGAAVVTAPTAADLAGQPADRWLDIPGHALDPGCSYEQWAAPLQSAPSVYGRVTSEAGRVVVQYWFYWIYNQWNDVHEGDWEMVQLDFDAATAEEALAVGPARYAYAQHEGSEYALAGAEKLELVDGTHPVVYSAEGSHAAFFSSSRWFGKSGATGFGCDDTSAPTTQIRPTVIALPGDDIPTTGPLAWLSYPGHWGEKAPSFNNGPTGPVSKSQWAAPITWVQDEGRDAVVALPFAQSSATRGFCRLSEAGSMIFIKLLDRPVLVLVVLVVVVAALAFVVRRSSRGVLGRAWRRGRREWRRLLPVGGLVLVAALAAGALQWVLLTWTRLGTLADAVGTSSAWVLPLVTAIGAVVAIPILSWSAAAALSVVVPPAPADEPVAGVLRHRAPWWATFVLVVVTGGAALLFWPLLVPASRWIVGPAVAVAEPGERARGALGRSGRLVRGHVWRSLGMLVTMLLVVALIGVIGALVLLLTSVSFVVAGALTALVGVVVVPYLAVVVAEFRLDLVSSAVDPPPGRSRPAGEPTRTGATSC